VQRGDKVKEEGEVLNVSILTGPFGPVQLSLQEEVRTAFKVSILTGPFGPVQQ